MTLHVPPKPEGDYDAQEAQEETSHVETVSSEHDPVVGEKRPREEDGDASNAIQQEDSMSQDNSEPSSAPPISMRSSQPPTGPIAMNSSGSGTLVHGGPNLQNGENSGMDALYIGDLQWVCAFCSLILLNFSENGSFYYSRSVDHG